MMERRDTSDLTRLENKVDILTDAVTKLVLFEERQAVQAVSITQLQERTKETASKLDMWINRGIGIWGFMAVSLSLYKALGH